MFSVGTSNMPRRVTARAGLLHHEWMVSPIAVVAVLPVLAETRPVFHSEADFQHALAVEVKRLHPEWRVRLETRPYPGVHLDLLIADPTDSTSVAVELKYLTDAWLGDFDGEHFSLTRQAAQDITGYDCVKDIARIERVVSDGHAQSGLAIVVTNDGSYWRTPGHGRVTNADAFRLHDGLVLSGTRTWGPNTGPGTMGKSRQAPISLSGTYALAWRPYSLLPGSRGEFRFLAVVV
jgi:hypothetical protein